MSDQNTNESTKDGKQTGGSTSDAGDKFEAITSQEELNRIIDKRLERERAKFADYAALKSKAAKLDQIEEANKTEAQKLADAKAAAERERDEAKAEALRFKVASKHGISDEDAELFLTGSDEDTLTKQAQRLTERTDQQKKHGPHVKREGATTTPANDPKRQ